MRGRPEWRLRIGGRRHPALLAAAVVVLALAAVACAPSLHQVAWVGCAWASLDASPDPRGTYDRAALLVPVSLGGVEGFVQLDKGATTSRLDKTVVDELGIPYEVVSEMTGWPPEQGRAWHVALRDFGFSGLGLPRVEMLLVEAPHNPARDAVESKMGSDVRMMRARWVWTCFSRDA